MHFYIADFKSNFCDKPLNLLGAAADVQLGAQNLAYLPGGHSEAADIGKALGQIAVAAVFGIRQIVFVPQYSSTATLYILRSEQNTGSGSVDSDFSLALKVVNDCDYLLKSHAVVDDVIEELGLDIEYKDLSEMISTSNPENTRILEVTVEADSPELAKRIVDRLCEIGQDKIAEAMGFQQVNLFEYGTVSDEPSNRMGVFTYALIGLVGAIAAYLVFLIMFVADDSLRTEDDIMQSLGLTVLAEIPDANGGKKGKYGHYSGYGKYYYGSKAYLNEPYGGAQEGRRD